MLAVNPTKVFSTHVVLPWPHPPGRNVVQVETEDMVLFWELPSVFCQWYSCAFELDGVVYNCAEQYMMAEKAKLFGDLDVRDKILATDNPQRHQQLGREAKGFDNDLWQANCSQIVVRGNLGKFSQSDFLRQVLLNTGTKLLVEASEVDKVWGIGLAPDDALALDRANWQGRNLLGEALMEVRSILQQQ
ncbi:hypothetical protein BASA81_005586 [Batrachochytrium salamandrivorans]|nr:hypothetical protein BASA81_005586 [Batrachochytrium salamandrivorans]